MRALLQRVKRASVTIEGICVGKIQTGLLIFLGVGKEDTQEECVLLANKLSTLRIFEDAQQKMNLCAKDIGAEMLVVSQFTLYADCKRGRRPGFTLAKEPNEAKKLYETMISLLENEGFVVAHGEFGADMQVSLQNDGPVTIMLDTDELKK